MTGAPVAGDWGTSFNGGATAVGARIDPPKGADSYSESTASTCPKALPPIEAVSASTLTPTNSESDEPEDGKNDRSDPQKVHGKSGTEENQHKQQCEYEYHAAIFPNGK